MSRLSPGARVGVLALLLAGGLCALLLLPVRELAAGLLQRVRDLGAWGPVILAAAYVPASLLLLPGSVLTLGAGFLFGVITGTVTVSVGSVLGACAAFLAGRILGREWVESRVARSPRFRALDEAVQGEAFRIVLLTRLSPIFPFNVLNYAYGVTQVAFKDYVLASWIGMLPGTILYVYLGSAAKSLADLAAGNVVEGGAEREIFFAVGLAATVVVTVLIARTATRALRAAVPQEGGNP